MDTERIVPAAEFIRHFGRYQTLARQEPVAVSNHGRVTGYFIAAEDYEAFKQFRERRRSFATVDLSEEAANAIITSRMDTRHEHLNTLLDDD